ncbi:MAG: bifunctional pyr operon transcriptional regulator/uracil phosphoribosyltransferase PyrR [Planctomycetes bacterium]|nr:bifunctional pyr operon transcriptional regulator/uracil phosphoribosyltransferase PyrR [Planctomycetota bacterium]MCW8135384.1 bifunctional pyr operon transcriptional regulator/uracil phosphoribosyltransferase PyrR [Planctomycetota bacterium]
MTSHVHADAAAIAQAIDRLAAEIAARHPQPPVLVGIRTNGVPLAQRLSAALGGCETGAIDITLYRDDLQGRALPQVLGSDIPGDIEGKRVILVDDVLYTGRTVRSALIELADYGRPQRVELCVLVDRGLRELPIAADYVGIRLETRSGDHVKVELLESGAGHDAVLLRRA